MKSPESPRIKRREKRALIHSRSLDKRVKGLRILVSQKGRIITFLLTILILGGAFFMTLWEGCRKDKSPKFYEEIEPRE